MSVASGLNGMAHCIDSMWGPRVDPINAALGAEGIRALSQGLPLITADPSGTEGREQALYGAYLSAVAFASAGSGLHHKICHVLGGTFNLPHAQTHATVLPYVLAFNAPYAPDAEARIAAAFGTAEALTGLQELRKRLDAPKALCGLRIHGRRDRRSRRRRPPRRAGLQPAPRHHRKPHPAPAGGPDRRRPGRPAGSLILPDASEGRQVRPAPHRLQEYSMSETTHAGNGISPEQAEVEQELVDTVVASFDKAGDPRLKEVMQSLTRHLHNFLREVRLTEDEWNTGIEFLTAAGHITDDKRQEFILLSDVLGASMQTIAINNEAYKAAPPRPPSSDRSSSTTPPKSPSAATSPAAPPASPAGSKAPSLTPTGNPVPGARIEVWEADEDGFYDVQYTDARIAGTGAPLRRRGRQVRVLGTHPHPVPHPARRAGRQDARSLSAGPPSAPPTCTSWSPPPACGPS